MAGRVAGSRAIRARKSSSLVKVMDFFMRQKRRDCHAFLPTDNRPHGLLTFGVAALRGSGHDFDCRIRSAGYNSPPMAKVDFREEVVNVALAELLEQRGMLSVPETIRKSVARNTRDLPDIIVADLLGIRMVIEGRFNSGKVARDSLLKDARERVEQGISPVCLAVLYPPELRSAESLPTLRRNLEKATVGIRVIS